MSAFAHATTLGESDPSFGLLSPVLTLPQDQPILFEVRLNQTTRGTYPVIFRRGDLLIRIGDLQAMGVGAPYGSPLVIDGVAYYSLRGLGATEIRVDKDQLILHADLPTARLPKQQADLLPRHPQGVRPHDNSAYFNYRYLANGDNSGPGSWVVGGELGIRYHDLLLRSDAARFHEGTGERTVRYGTTLVHDNQTTLQRFMVGDFAATSGNLGNSLNLGGISFSKTYSIDPYFVTQPMAGFTSPIASPSEVEIYLDGTRVKTLSLAPGEFELENLSYYGGLHDLEMVIRDSFGREQRLAYPYYFSDQNLRQGLHDYSYNAGWQRTDVGTANDSYANPVFSAYHRYGLSDALTVGMRGEAGDGVANLGPTAVWRSTGWGVLSGGVSVSDGDQGSGWAISAAHSYQKGAFSIQSALRRYSNHYGWVGNAVDSDRTKHEFVAGIGYGLGRGGNVALNLRSRAGSVGEDEESLTLSYSRTFRDNLHFTAALGSVSGSDRSTYLLAGVSYHPGDGLHASLRHQQNGGIRSDSLQLGNTPPFGEGFAYRLTADRSVTDFGEGERFSPWMQYYGPHGIYTASAASDSFPGEKRQSYQLGMSGGIAYVADTVSFSRPISDSFALVDVGDLAGVRVYSGGQEMGRTNKDGRVLISHLGSYSVNRVSIDDRDFPMDYSVDVKEMRTVPPLRSGSLIRFEVKRLRAVFGYLTVQVAGVRLPAEYLEFDLDVDGSTVTVPTGRDGEFYLENLPPARYRAHFDFQGRRCEFELKVLASAETLSQLGEIDGCELSQ